MSTFVQDLRFACRMLAKNPGFTGVAVITLALGIGANTAIFTVVNAVLLRQLTLPRPGQLVTVWETFRQGISSASVADFKDWREQNDIFQGLAAYQTGDFNLKGAESPERVPGAYVTANFFDVMGEPTLQGRGLLSGEDVLGRNRVVVLSEALWKG